MLHHSEVMRAEGTVCEKQMMTERLRLQSVIRSRGWAGRTRLLQIRTSGIQNQNQNPESDLYHSYRELALMCGANTNIDC